MPIEYSSNIGKEPPQGGTSGGGSTNAGDLTSGTLADARLSSGILNATYQHNQYVTTTGTATAYVATPTVAIVLADGVEVLCGIHATSGAAPTLNVSGTGARAIYKEGAAGLTAVGTGQLLSGPNIYKFTYNAGFSGWVVSSPLFLQASDMPSGIDAADIADGSVTNTEFQYISTLTSNAQDQLNGKASTSHTHAASDTTSGSFNTARIADGTATAGYVPISDGDGTSTWGAPSASDSTKLALDGSNDMAANISFSGEVAATGGTTREIGFNASGGFINAPTGDIALQAMVNNVSLLDIFKHGVRTGIGDPGNGTVAFTTNGVTRFEYDVNQFVCSVPLHCESNLRWTGTQTSAGASIANDHRDVSGNLFRNVATGCMAYVNVNNVEQLGFGANGIVFPTAQTAFSVNYASIHYDATGDLNYNVATGDVHDFTVNGTRSMAIDAAGRILGYGGGVNWDFSAGYNVSHVPQVFPSSARISGASLGQITSNAVSGALGIEALNSAYSFISAGGIGTTLPEVVVHGLSETAYAGAIEVKAGAVARTNNGTWTNIFSLAKGAHHGAIFIFVGGYGYYAFATISNTTLGGVSDGTTLGFVNSGSEAAGNVAIRISGGYIQINVGTSMASGLKFAIHFQGTVV